MIWRIMFPLIFIYVLIDGVIIHFMFPNPLPQLYKDILIILTFFMFLTSESLFKWTGKLYERLGPAASLCAMSFLFLGILQIFNPMSAGLTTGLLGLKILYLYWLLAILGFVYVNRFEALLGWLKMMLYLSVPVNIFGLLQYLNGPKYLVSIFGPSIYRAIDMAALEVASNPTESFLRIIGTFTSCGQYADFLAFNGMFGIAIMFSAVGVRRREQIFLIACQILNFTVLLAAGSRSRFMCFVLALIFFIFLARRSRPMLLSFLISGILLYGVFSWLGERVILRYKALGRAQIVKERTFGVTAKMFVQYLEKYPMGRGPGAASTAARYLSKFEASKREFIENYFTKLQVETGIIGVILFYLFLILLVKRWLTDWLPWMNDQYYHTAAALSACCFSFLIIEGIFFILDSPPVPIFLWTLVGMVARLSDLSYEKQMAADESS